MVHLRVEVPPQLVVVLVAVALAAVWRGCKKDATATLPPVVQVQGFQVPVEQLIQVKDTRTAYLLLFGAGLVGAHHFYLDRLQHGCVAALTVNFLGLGWLLDLFCIPYYTNSFNQSAAPGALRDRTCRRLCCCSPLICLVVVCNVFAIVLGVPSMVHGMGLVDLEERMAGTAGNPYVILESDRLATSEELRKAYDLQLREVESSQDCKNEKNGKACKMKRKQLKKALDFALKKSGGATQGRRSKRKGKDADSTDQWFDDRRAEWDAFVLEIKDGVGKMFKSSQEDQNEEL